MLAVNTKHIILNSQRITVIQVKPKVQIDGVMLNSLFNSMFLFFVLFYVVFSYSNPQQWTATFGVSTISPRLRVRVRAILAHAEYNSITRDNDIAVVQLDRPVTFTRNIHRVCLPAATQNIIPDSVAYVTGWGSLTYGGKYLWKMKPFNNKSSVICFYANVFVFFVLFCFVEHFNPG